MKRRFRSSFAAAVITVWVAPVAFATSPLNAISRLEASVAGALAASPQLEMAGAEARARQKSLDAEAAPGAPFVEMQTEGRSSSFGRETNAADYLRVGKPFLLPWQHRRAQKLTEQTRRELGFSRRHAESSLAAEVAARWFEAAALVERREVVRKSLAAVDRALMVQRARLSHGEVAGIDVLQLELDRAREASRSAELESQFESVHQGLRLLCVEGLQLPQAGDLTALAAHFREELEDEQPPLSTAPLLQVARAKAATAGARAALVKTTAWGIPEGDLEWERIPEVDGIPGHDALGLRLSLPLPLGKAGRLSREAAAAEARAAEAAAKLARLQLQEQLRAARSAYEGARTRLSALAPGLKRLDETEHSLAEQVRLGAISSIIYLDVKSRLDEMRMESIAAASALLEARLRLAGLLASSELFPLTWSSKPEVSP